MRNEGGCNALGFTGVESRRDEKECSESTLEIQTILVLYFNGR